MRVQVSLTALEFPPAPSEGDREPHGKRVSVDWTGARFCFHDEFGPAILSRIRFMRGKDIANGIYVGLTTSSSSSGAPLGGKAGRNSSGKNQGGGNLGRLFR